MMDSQQHLQTIFQLVHQLKMHKVASYIIEEGLEVYADKLHIKQLTKLVEEQFQLH